MAASDRRKVVLAWIAAFSTLDVPTVGEFLTDDYTHVVLPSSLQWPVRTSKEAYVAFLTPILAHFTSFAFAVKEIVEDTEKGKVAIHASSTGMTATGAPYANEYTLIVQVREDGSGSPKICSVKEFFDSQFTVAFFAAENERIASSGGNLINLDLPRAHAPMDNC